MAHTQTTRAELEAALFDRLGDNLFYSNVGAYPEIRLYLNEALRVWNSLAHFWRDRIVFQTVAGQPFYKITSPALTTNPPLRCCLTQLSPTRILSPRLNTIC
jgi:hypothetical protein